MRLRAALALVLIAPAPTAGVLFGLTLREGLLGTILWVVAKIWLFGLPAAWHLLVDRQQPSWSAPRRGGLGVGAVLGLGIGLVVVAAYLLLGQPIIDVDGVRAAVEPVGLTTPARFVGLGAYIVTVNALLEEYVYRWFVFRKWEILVGERWAVLGAAVVFTTHHALILAALLPPRIAFLGSAGVFAGGLIWSWLYLRYRSVWPGYVSHAVVDVAVLGVGYVLIFV